MNTRWMVTMGLSLAAAAVLWAQGLIVCKACGREAKSGETVCAHCSATLPKPQSGNEAAEKPAAPVIDRDAEVGRGAYDVVVANVRQARELEMEQPGGALSYYQNALALMRLVPPGKFPASVGESILGGRERVMQAMQRGQVMCKKCNGSGKYQLDLSKVDESQGIKAVSGVACSVCKGVGSFAGFADVSKVKMAILQGRQDFERRQMLKGDVKVGRALVPAALEKKLNNRERALVMTGMPMPCETCQLVARQPCTVCRGSGWMKCTYPGCSNGVFKEAQPKTGRQAKRLNEDLPKKCPRCEGLGEIPCEMCQGRASVACKKCDGSGSAPRCSRCTGSGLMLCSKCKGTGAVKGAPCSECKGETMMLCTTCRGEGAQAR
ncbi:MAG: hypothetical protein WCK89_17070 [bacterium]